MFFYAKTLFTTIPKCFWLFFIHYIEFKSQDMFTNILENEKKNYIKKNSIFSSLIFLKMLNVHKKQWLQILVYTLSKLYLTMETMWFSIVASQLR
jgi:hypothetical protein